MSLINLINGLDDRFITEELKSFIITYKEDNGKEQTSKVSGNSESDAKRRFLDSKEGREIRVTSVTEDTEEQLEEENVTGNLDGGLGQPRIPHAFQRSRPTSSDRRKERENATSSTGFGIVSTKSKNYADKMSEMMDRVERITHDINEAKYSDYRNDETLTPKQKINRSISEVNKTMYEVERMINHAMKLKTEVGMESDAFWKTTRIKFSKISERMLRIGNKLREFNN